MGRPSKEYRPRDPAANALYHVVRDHFEALRAHAAHLYHGVLAPRAAGRSAIVSRARARAPADGGHGRSGGGWRWASLMRRAFGFDVLACGCGGRLRLIALVEPGAVCARILRHLGVPAEVPAARPSRAPPPAYDANDQSAPDFPEFDR